MTRWESLRMESSLSTTASGGSPPLDVKIRLSHSTRLAGSHRVVIAPGVVRQHAPATLEADSAQAGKRSAPNTLLGTSSQTHWSICLQVGKALSQSRR